MAQFNQLSKREWEVAKLLLQGKSNKLIASSLGISDRTVEFHLKNIYIKYQVSSRIELILKLGNATGKVETEKLGYSTVDRRGERTENRDRFNSRMDWATSFRDTVSIIGKELEMKSLLNTKHILVSIVTALFVGFLLIVILDITMGLSVEDFSVLTVPFFIVLATIGVTVGVIGKQRNKTLLRVLFSVIFGTGLSPLMVIPLMRFIVIPLGGLFGVFDSSADKIESTIAMGIMITLWLIASITLGIVLLPLSIKIQTDNHSQSVKST